MIAAMAVESNGKAVDSSSKGINGQAVVPRTRSTKPKKSILGGLLSMIIRQVPSDRFLCISNG